MHLQNFDIRTVFVDVRDIEIVERALVQERARILYFESMSNPLVRVSDTAPGRDCTQARSRQHHRQHLCDALPCQAFGPRCRHRGS
jgi:cystathionine beta-lyase/cystathionine gamma-synthase